MPYKKRDELERGKAFLALPANTRGKDWFVGDIHGELDLLRRVLDEVRFDPAVDRLICAGDLVDRGPDNLGVLELYKKSPWFHAVMGNHEALALWHADALKAGTQSDAFRMHVRVGGDWLNFALVADVDLVVQTLAQLPLAIEVSSSDIGSIGVVHAEVTGPWQDIRSCHPASCADAMQSGSAPEVDMIWSRNRARAASVFDRFPTAEGVKNWMLLEAQPYLLPVPGIDLLIHGHTTMSSRRPLWCLNCIWLDTGAEKDGGWLSLYDPKRSVCVQVPHDGGEARRFEVRQLRPGPEWMLPDERIKELNEYYAADTLPPGVFDD